VVLVDTGPLVALCDARDSKHRAAVRHLEALAAEGLAACDAVLTESCVHLPHRSQRLRLRALLIELPIEPIAVDRQPGARLEVLDWLLKYADHEPDWADAWLAVLSSREKYSKVWTYDREFRSIWRRPDGSAIPLAVNF
jgi:predicted nucleic acid-binding protein